MPVAVKVGELQAEIALYGAMGHGYGFIAAARGGQMFGNGELNINVGLTQALFNATEELNKAGFKGKAMVFAPGGQYMAEVNIQNPVYYGDLKWGPATKYEIPVEALLAAAEPGIA